jgi:hypothetical protein
MFVALVFTKHYVYIGTKMWATRTSAHIVHRVLIDTCLLQREIS